MIPNEAAEAAARGLAVHKWPTAIGVWDSFGQGMQDDFRDQARAALEAAAPHMHAYLLAELRDRDEKLAKVLEAVEKKAARWESVAGARESDNLIERDPEIWLENRTRSITLRANAHNIRAAVAAAGGGGEQCLSVNAGRQCLLRPGHAPVAGQMYGHIYPAEDS